MARQDEMSDLTSEIEKSIRTAQRLKLGLIVYILTMAQLEVANLSARKIEGVPPILPEGAARL
ncbi:MAG: hypothetical protein R3D69_03200 [Xanthobacteraceae bacterium]